MRLQKAAQVLDEHHGSNSGMGRWRNNGGWKTVTHGKPKGGANGAGGGNGGKGYGKGGGKGSASSGGRTGTAMPAGASGHVPQHWIDRGWVDHGATASQPTSGGVRRVVAGTTFADVAAARTPVPAEQARIGQRIVIPERSEEETKRTEALRKQCVAVAASIEAVKVAAHASAEAGEEPSDGEVAYLANMEAHLRQLQQRRDASKSPEIRYVGSITKEQQSEKALLAAEDNQAKLAIQANEARKALQAAAEKTARLREEHRQAKLNTVRDAAEAGVSAPEPGKAAQTMVTALAEQYGAVGSNANPELTAFLQQSAASIAAALQKFAATQPKPDVSGENGAAPMAATGSGQVSESHIPAAEPPAPPPPQEPPAHAAGAVREPSPPPPPEEHAMQASPNVATSGVNVAVSDTQSQPATVEDVPMRQQASAEEVAAARPFGTAQQADSERIQKLRAALRANLEMGCSTLEIRTSVDSITGALASEEDCRVAVPCAKRRISDGTAAMDVQDTQEEDEL